MIPGPLVADLSSPVGAPGLEGQPRSAARLLVPAGIALVAMSLVALVAWGIFLSPLGFKRYPLAGMDRTFTVHEAGTYVVYLEGPGERRPSLPPAIEIGAATLGGQRVEVRPMADPGVIAAPAAYDVLGHEGRGLAVVKVDRSGTFVLHVQPIPEGDVDQSLQRVVTTGTVAIGRGATRTWLGGWWGLMALAGLPAVAGFGLIIVGWRSRTVR
ncbi:MAG TPA: hypothetical protein VIJ47_12110 [Acidimicrobiales bacterium]